MKKLFAGIVAVLPLLALAPVASAQGVAAAYAGPRFPGGPDSLRAYLSRHPLRNAGREPVFVQFDVMPADHRHKPTVIVPPGRKALPPAVSTAALRTVAEMPDWIPGRQDVEIPITTVTLCLNAPPAALAYADEMPMFPGLEPGIIGFYHHIANTLEMKPNHTPKKLAGDVFMYFEVSETGQLENARVIGGAAPALNDEALDAVARLPTTARIPAQLHGRPVRIYYVLSIGFVAD